MMSAHTKKENGFTLVELSIVMLVVGLLIGGVLKGVEIASAAKINATVAQVQAYDTAVRAFRASYNALPGDMWDAASRLPGFSADACTGAGNGNGIIVDLGNGVGNNSARFDEAPRVGGERTSFWNHLSKTNLVDGYFGYYSGYGGSACTLPEAKAGGWITVGSTIETSLTGVAYSTNPQNGHYFAIGSQDGTITGSAPVLVPAQAMQIDTKMDDGIAGSGSVVAPNDLGGLDCVSGTAYNANSRAKACSLYIRMQQ